ncbi:MAG: type II secretion system F family protein [Eubacterium sp.]|nr:type II secretion system F family protein [Eubacterium sp.]MBQ6362496.1 type II secretion system F family protein [Lachnospiraceae bacterium]
MLLEAAAAVLFLAFFFYHTPAAALFLSPLAVPLMKRRAGKLESRKKAEMSTQFKEAVSSVLMALRAGYSAENAFREACREMEFLFGGDSGICRELYRIDRGLDNHIPLEKLLQEFADRCGVDEILEFAEVFSIAKRSGGNMSEILARTISMIQSRIDVEAEIRVMLSEKVLEQRIMNAVPFLIIFYISASSKGFFNVLYGNLTGVLVMSACLAVYLFAFGLSERIMAIRI